MLCFNCICSSFAKSGCGGDIIDCLFYICRPVSKWNTIYLLYQNLVKAKMQLKFQQTNQTGSAKLLQKCSSLPSFTDTTNSSSNSIDSIDDQYRKSAIRWILNYTKKVTRDTQYLAISYVNRLSRRSMSINEQNYEKVAVAVLLIASKMNQIYPPKIASMVAKCKKVIPREQIIALEGSLLGLFDFDVAVDSNAYTCMQSVLGCLYAEKLEECEKLLRMVAAFREIYQFGEQILAYAIIYLIIPDFVRKMKLRDSQKIKTLAIRIYNIYTDTKDKYDKEKENRAK